MGRRRNNSGFGCISLVGFLVLLAFLPYIIGIGLFALFCYLIYRLVKHVKNRNDNDKFTSDFSNQIVIASESQQPVVAVNQQHVFKEQTQQSFKKFYANHKQLTWAIVSVISVLLLWALTISTFVTITDIAKNDSRIESSASRKRRSNKESETTTVTATTTETTTTETTTTEITTEATTEATTTQPVTTEAPSAPASNFYSAPATEQTTTPPQNTYYPNCSAVRNAGAAPIYAGQPGYGRHLDRDGDGVGCEN